MDSRKIRDIIVGIGGAWEPAILIALKDGPKRSARLRREVSQRLDYRIFRDTTGRLVAKRLIKRTDEDRKVTFQITKSGRRVLKLLLLLEMWAARHPEEAKLLTISRHRNRS